MAGENKKPELDPNSDISKLDAIEPQAEVTSGKEQPKTTGSSLESESISSDKDSKKAATSTNSKTSKLAKVKKSTKSSKPATKSSKSSKSSKKLKKDAKKPSRYSGYKKSLSNIYASSAVTKTKDLFSKKSVGEAKKILSKVPSSDKLKSNISNLNKKIEKKISSAGLDISKQKTKLSWLRPYVELARFDRPIGAILLFLPLAFGMALAKGLDSLLPKYWYLWLIFAIGAFSLRAAGCIWNDIIDKKFDKLVERTKNRPLASETLSISHAFIFLIILMFIGFLALLALNTTSQIFAIIILPLVAIYPFTKRFTNFAQLFLGIVFNWGVWIGWFSILALDGHSNMIANMGIFNSYFAPLLLYIGTIFWTIGYDTIYSLQDRKEDIKLGLKSLSILFKDKEKKFLSVVYLIFWLFAVIAMLAATTSFDYFIIVFIPIIHLLLQVYKLDLSKPETFKASFYVNSISGLILLYTILVVVD